VPAREEELFLARRLLEIAATDLATSEAYNYTFIADSLLKAATGHATAPEYLRVANPVAPEQTCIRRHVLPSLLGNLKANLREFADVRLMEHGKGYHPEVRDEHGLPRQVRELAFVWSVRDGEHPFAALRESIGWLLQRVGYPAQLVRSWHGADQPWVHSSRAVAIDRDGSPVGFVAHVHPTAARASGIPATTAIACIDLGALIAGGRQTPKYSPVPTFPVLPVDVALLVDSSVQVATVADFLRRVGRKLVRQVDLFEVYRGEQVPPGKKSLNFTVTLAADDRTLQDEDEAKFLAKVREQVGEIGAELRG
jgi:phenylalanyl-tRNA synthetase beta chain